MERNLFGIAAVISSVGFLIWSIGQATAFPQGPNVSLGSNPLESFYGSIVGQTASEVQVFSNTSGQDFIITSLQRIPTSPSGQNCAWNIDGGNFTYTSFSSFTYNASLDSVNPLNLVLHDGQVLSMYKTSSSQPCWYFVSGYYAHP